MRKQCSAYSHLWRSNFIVLSKLHLHICIIYQRSPSFVSPWCTIEQLGNEGTCWNCQLLCFLSNVYGPRLTIIKEGDEEKNPPITSNSENLQILASPASFHSLRRRNPSDSENLQILASPARGFFKTSLVNSYPRGRIWTRFEPWSTSWDRNSTPLTK
jgi:hypothetical protein